MIENVVLSAMHYWKLVMRINYFLSLKEFIYFKIYKYHDLVLSLLIFHVHLSFKCPYLFLDQHKDLPNGEKTFNFFQNQILLTTPSIPEVIVIHLQKHIFFPFLCVKQ